MAEDEELAFEKFSFAELRQLLDYIHFMSEMRAKYLMSTVLKRLIDGTIKPMTSELYEEPFEE